MIGDVELIKPIHIKKAEILIPTILEVRSIKNTQKFVVSIGGESGTGKTEISRMLQKIFWETYKLRAKLIHIDDYYISDYHTRNEERKSKGESADQYLHRDKSKA